MSNLDSIRAMRYALELEEKGEKEKEKEKERIKSDGERVVFIIGAGGSKPYGYPVGKELIGKIKENLENANFIKILEQHFDKALIERFFIKIQTDFPLNVDKFLRNNASPEFVKLGSFLIMYFLTGINPVVDVNNDWYAFVSDILINKNSSAEDVFFKNFKFITFNYDHVSEWQLINKLKACEKFNFGSSLIEYINKNTLHIYGALNNFDDKTLSITPYQEDDLVNFCLENCGKISTIYEDKILDISSSLSGKIKSYILEADRIYIVGFGFDPDNVALLGLKDLASKEKHQRTKIFCSDYKGLAREKFKYLKKEWGKNIDSYYSEDNSIVVAFEKYNF